MAKRTEVSIHASTREATQTRPARTTSNRRFNPRLHAGGDSAGLRERVQRHVSIHASTREATWWGIVSRVEVPVFQSTPPRGRRPDARDMAFQLMRFQSTPPRGRRPVPAGWENNLARFNPRLHAGGDGYVDKWFRYSWEFQSTPPRGRRHNRARCRNEHRRFNPRLHAGGDLLEEVQE